MRGRAFMAALGNAAAWPVVGRGQARGFRAVRVDNAFERLLHATSKSIHAPTRRSSIRACPLGVIFENPRFSFCSMSTCEFSTRLLCWTWQPRCAGRWARPAKRAHGEIQCRSIDKRSALGWRQGEVRQVCFPGLLWTEHGQDGYLELPNAEALQLLQSDHQFDVVVTDYAMPGMSGLDLAMKIRTIRPGLLIVLATGGDELGPA